MPPMFLGGAIVTRNGPRPFAGSVERSLGREIERDPARRGGRLNILGCFDRKNPMSRKIWVDRQKNIP